MTRVVIFKDLSDYFNPSAPDCNDGCPIAMYRERLDGLDCNYFDDFNDNHRCPFKQDYGEEVNKHIEKIIEIMEGNN